MRRLTRRAVLCAAAAVLFVPACGSSDDSSHRSAPNSSTTSTTASTATTTSPADQATTTTSAKATGTVIAVTATDGKVDGGVQRKRVPLGSTVTIRATSDKSDEIHVHGYDLKQDLEAGKPGEITFTAKIPGVFEVELEKAGNQLLELEVS